VTQDGWLRQALSQLSGEERDAFLLRLAQGEPHLSVELHRRLREVAPLSEPERPPRRRVAQLLQEAE
jgi:beta-lactamase class D